MRRTIVCRAIRSGWSRYQEWRAWELERDLVPEMGNDHLHGHSFRRSSKRGSEGGMSGEETLRLDPPGFVKKIRERRELFGVGRTGRGSKAPERRSWLCVGRRKA
jgi:hypothetical protein